MLPLMGALCCHLSDNSVTPEAAMANHRRHKDRPRLTVIVALCCSTVLKQEEAERDVRDLQSDSEDASSRPRSLSDSKVNQERPLRPVSNRVRAWHMR